MAAPLRRIPREQSDLASIVVHVAMLEVARVTPEVATVVRAG
jgi:hypothetical protein